MKIEKKPTYVDNVLNEIYEDEDSLARGTLIEVTEFIASIVHAAVLDAMDYRDELEQRKRRHSAESRQRMSEAAQARWDKMSPEERAKRIKNLKGQH